MAVTAIDIGSGPVSPSQVFVSNSFSDADIIVFNTPDVPASEGFEFSASLVVEVPRPGLLGQFQQIVKSIFITSEPFVDTAYIYRIPWEYLSQDLRMYVVIEVSESFNLELWILRSDCGLDELCAKVDFNNNLTTLLTARQLLGDVTALAEFGINLARLLEGDVTALPGVLLPIARPVLGLLPDGIADIFEGEIIDGGGLFDIRPDDIVKIFL